MRKKQKTRGDGTERNNKISKTVGEYAVISFGILLVAIGVYFFKFPNSISTGGVTGAAVVLAQVFPAVSQSTFVLILNLIFLAVGFIVLGRDFGFKTVYGSLLLSGFLELFDLLMAVFGAPADLLPLTVTAANPAGEPVLELFFAVAFPAAGAAILFYNHGSSGGTDVAAMIVHKYTSIDSGKALLICDFFLVLFTFYDFGSGTFEPTRGLLSLAGLVAKAVAVDTMIAGINQSKYHLVITTRRAEVEDYITTKLKRGATVWKCEGAYTHGEEYAFVAVMNRVQSYHFRHFIKEIDPKSFVIITNSSDILGKGFRQI